MIQGMVLLSGMELLVRAATEQQEGEQTLAVSIPQIIYCPAGQKGHLH